MSKYKVVGKLGLEFLYVASHGSLTWIVINSLNFFSVLIPFLLALSLNGWKLHGHSKFQYLQPEVRFSEHFIVNFMYIDSYAPATTKFLTIIKKEQSLDVLSEYSEPPEFYKNTTFLYLDTNLDGLNEHIEIIIELANNNDWKFELKAIEISFIADIQIQNKGAPKKALLHSRMILEPYMEEYSVTGKLIYENIPSDSWQHLEPKLISHFYGILQKYPSISYLPPDETQSKIIKLDDISGMLKFEHLFGPNGIQNDSTYGPKFRFNFFISDQVQVTSKPLSESIFELWFQFLVIFIPIWFITDLIKFILLKYGLLPSSRTTNYARKFL